MFRRRSSPLGPPPRKCRAPRTLPCVTVINTKSCSEEGKGAEACSSSRLPGAAPRAAAALAHLPICSSSVVTVAMAWYRSFSSVYVEHTVQSLTELDKLSLEMGGESLNITTCFVLKIYTWFSDQST